MMAPVEMAFMAIVIPAWATKLMIDTPHLVMYSCSQTGPLVGLRANKKTVAQNTTEAEYMAMTDAANQAAWYESFLTELGYEVDDPIPLHGDNKGAIDLALNPVTGRRSKHIAIRHHVIHEYIEKGTISLIRTPTAEMVADGFTKSLLRALLLQHNNDMGLSA
jgi:hypothetical protein